jgi:hypothetical protein
MKRLLILVLAIAITAGTTSTAGAVTIGSKCVSNSGGPTTMFTTGGSHASSFQIPFNGILTKWGTDRTMTANQGKLRALIARYVGSDMTIVSSSAPSYVWPETIGEFNVRIPVVAGDILGITAFDSEPRMCTTGISADSLSTTGSVALGDTFTPSSLPGSITPIWAEIENDADGDGYGDETQDKCPQSAASIELCPVLSIGQLVSSSKGVINIIATANIDTSLTATATNKVRLK